IEVLAANGFEHHSGKRIADCAFDLFYTEDTIAYVMYFSDTETIKISMDKRSTFALPTLEEDNIYEKTTDATITQVGLGDSIDNGMLYISKMSDGSFIVIDGGISAGYIYDSLVKLSGQTTGIRIAAWLLTHHHNDHAEGFLATSSKYADRLIVEKVIHCQPRPDQLRPGEGSDYEAVKDRIVNGIRNFKATNRSLEQIKAHPGMEIYIRDAKITVLATIDTIEPRIISNVNNASMVFRMEVGEKSIIFLGDSEPMQTKAMYAQFGAENFRCDALQLAHHGYGNTNTGNDQNVINEASDATVVFCPVSTHDLTSSDANVMGMPQNALFFYNPEVTVHVGAEDNVTLDLYTLEQIGERWEPKE
ncbi:MAG: MBL fold metallo-hydrolase, partial [Clostridia bacterium]|nr:MBL fold metallo-hydrolase [Clostridia bacterium]